MKKLSALILGILFGLLCACTSSGQKALILAADDAQRAASETYADATRKQAAADTACVAAYQAMSPAARPQTPKTPDEKDAVCTLIGKPLPFSSTKLQNVSGPINAAHALIVKANDVRVAPGSTAEQIANALGAILSVFVETVDSFKVAGINVPARLAAWNDDAKKAGVK